MFLLGWTCAPHEIKLHFSKSTAWWNDSSNIQQPTGNARRSQKSYLKKKYLLIEKKVNASTFCLVPKWVLGLRWYCINFLPPLPSVLFDAWQLQSIPCGSSVSTDVRWPFTQWWVVGHLGWTGYPLPSPGDGSYPAWIGQGQRVSCNTTRCVSQSRVIGHSITMTTAGRALLLIYCRRLADGRLYSTYSSSCKAAFSFIIYAHCFFSS